MKVGINLLPLRPGKNGGMEIYLRNLLEHLFRIDPDSHYYLITAPYNDTSLEFSVPNCTKIPIHIEARKFQNIHLLFKKLFRKGVNSHTTLEDIINKYQFDIWFCPFLSLEPRPLSIPGIVTIPDIQHEFYPEYFSIDELSLRKSYIQPSCELATEIITISDFSKQTFVKKLGIDPSKIHVIHLAAGDNFSQSDQKRNDIKAKYNLPDNYFFYPANAWTHKNHLILIMAFYVYRKTFDDQMHLVLTGSDLKNNPTIQTLITQDHLEDRIHILDYVNKEDMPELYNHAKALVFPSIFEGFGIPLLEAMAMGCPIIASNTTSIPEVAGDAAYLFDPKKPQSICDAMYRIIHDTALRSTLIDNGKKCVASFSYDTVAQKHLEVFKVALKKTKEASGDYLNQEKITLTGRYPDGWIAGMEFNYRGPRQFRYIQMDIIAGLPIKYPLKMRIVINKYKKNTIIIPSIGKFSFEFAFPGVSWKSNEYCFEIIPGKLFTPKKLGINGDDRELSVIMDSLMLIDNHGAATQFIEKTIL